MSAAREHYPVRVAAVISETADTSSFVLQAPDGFCYSPGQFVTVRVGDLARCYSLCSSPHADQAHAITVKRAGYASAWLLDNVRAGTVLDMLPPAGTFTPRSLDSDFLLLAAGSGITPVMSILKSALAAGRGRLILVYANRDERSVIFGGTLRELAASADGRLTVIHHLDSVSGPPTAAFLGAVARPYAGFEAFVCGPGPFMATVRAALGTLGVPAARVHMERFLSLEENPFEAAPPPQNVVAATLTVTLDDETRVLAWPAGVRMLDQMLEAGLDAPYSCRQGICGACACQLVEGKVDMAHNEVLEDADLADGYILACQATAATESVAISY